MFNPGDYVRNVRDGRIGRVNYNYTYYTSSFSNNQVNIKYEGCSYDEVVYESDLILVQNNYSNNSSYPYSAGCTATCYPTTEVKKQNTVEKIYRALKDTPWFTTGAILSNKDNSCGYKPVDDIWSSEETPELKKYLNDNGVNIASQLVENTPSWFERVYSVKSIKGMYYVAKDKMKELLSKGVVDDGKDAE